MAKRNLADPAFEPSDEDFRELLHNAGEDARAAHQKAMEVMREQIQALREAAVTRTTPSDKKR
jgi:hypothetical protein